MSIREEIMRDKFFSLVGLLLVAAGFLLGFLIYKSLTNEVFYQPKFQVDDCVREVAEANEFQDERLIGSIQIIERVGKEEYWVYENFLFTDKFYSARKIKYFDEDHVLVSCETGERI